MVNLYMNRILPNENGTRCATTNRKRTSSWGSLTSEVIAIFSGRTHCGQSACFVGVILGDSATTVIHASLRYAKWRK